MSLLYIIHDCNIIVRDNNVVFKYKNDLTYAFHLENISFQNTWIKCYYCHNHTNVTVTINVKNVNNNNNFSVFICKTCRELLMRVRGIHYDNSPMKQKWFAAINNYKPFIVYSDKCDAFEQLYINIPLMIILADIIKDVRNIILTFYWQIF